MVRSGPDFPPGKERVWFGCSSRDSFSPCSVIKKRGVSQSCWHGGEAFYGLTWAKDPGIHVLASAAMPPTRSAGEHKGEVVPQIWTYEHTVPGGQPARAFVWMQGHTYANFANYQIQRTLLRGIAWAGKRPVEELVSYVAPPPPPRTRPQ